MRILWLSIVILLVGIAAAFALLNAQVVSVHFIVRVYELPLAAVLLLGILLGALLSLALFSYPLLKLSVANRRLSKQLAK